jgi:2-dehydro-3-deoxyglucarate aldolase/4-hydroxy-2-oxoheptanedioate aldolase
MEIIEGVEKGLWISIGSPIITELASMAGFDWLLFDLEHGCLTEDKLLENLQASKTNNIKLIVRVPEVNKNLISRVLDWGASGIMLPMVSSKEDALKCIDAMYYAPLGSRGYTSSCRSYNFGLSKKNEFIIEDKPIFIAQIENIAGIDNIESILSIKELDMVFVGPSDLKKNLEAYSKDAPTLFKKAIKDVAAASKKYNKKSGILIQNHNDIPNLIDLGYTFLGMSSDIKILRYGFDTILNEKYE